MENLYVRTVFFVRDAPAALEFYTKSLGFKLDWTHEQNGRPYVIQVSLLGMEIILNQTETDTRDRPGHGRVFAGLDDAQTAALFQHFKYHGISPVYGHWGAPTLIVVDQDQNELFFWLSDTERDKLAQEHSGAR